MHEGPERVDIAFSIYRKVRECEQKRKVDPTFLNQKNKQKWGYFIFIYLFIRLFVVYYYFFPFFFFFFFVMRRQRDSKAIELYYKALVFEKRHHSHKQIFHGRPK